MTTRCKVRMLLVALCLTCIVGAQGVPFVYQGRLTESGNPATGAFEMEFKLFDSPDVGGGMQQGNTIINSQVAVNNGLFTVTLDFQAAVFDGSARYLEIRVKRAGSANALSLLAPRQTVTPLPYAIHSLSASKLNDVPATSFVQANSAGNVGIGTTSPQTFLHLYRESDSLTHTIETGGGTNAWTKVSFKNLNGLWDIGTSRGFNNDVFYIDRQGSSLLDFQFSTRGSLGLGIEPQAKLHLYDRDSITHLIETSGGLNTWAKLSFRNENGQWDIGTSRGFNGDQFYITRPGASTIAFAVQPNGDTFVSGSGTIAGNAVVNGNAAVGTTVKPDAKLAISTGEGHAALAQNASQTHAAAAGVNLNAGPGVYGESRGAGPGVLGKSANGPAIYADGNAAQQLNKGGLVKAMAYINPFLPAEQYVVHCFNSNASQPDTAPCGISVVRRDVGDYEIGFGFDVRRRFFSVNPAVGIDVGRTSVYPGASGTTVIVTFHKHDEVVEKVDASFYLLVY